MHLLSHHTYHPLEATKAAHLCRCVHRCHAVLGPHVQRSASLGNKEFEHIEVALLRRQVHRSDVVVHLRVGAATYNTWGHASSWCRQSILPLSAMSPRARRSPVDINFACPHLTGRQANWLWQLKGRKARDTALLNNGVTDCFVRVLMGCAPVNNEVRFVEN